MIHEWKEGMLVVIHPAWGDSLGIGKISKVGRKHIVLQNGEKYRLNGFYVSTEQFPKCFIEPLTIELRVQIGRQRAIRLIRATDLESLSWNQLSRIAGIVGKEKRGEDYKPEFLQETAEVKET